RRPQKEQDDCKGEPAPSRHRPAGSANVQTDPPAGTLARSGSPASAPYTVAAPLRTVTYWRPSLSQVIGRPVMPEPVWNDQSLRPVLASKAMNWPFCEPVKTTPPSVLSTPAQNGDLFSVRQTALPATGSQ